MFMKIVNLFKYYGDNIILDNINLEIKNKGLYLIYGDSGQGKTTLFNIIFKQENYDDGYIVIMIKYLFAKALIN